MYIQLGRINLLLIYLLALLICFGYHWLGERIVSQRPHGEGQSHMRATGVQLEVLYRPAL